MTHRIAQITVRAYRVPIANPVATSFGAMHSRPAVFVRLEDKDGTFGWGEVFANWPAAGAEHRARLIVEDMADLLVGCSFDGPSDLFETLTRRTHIRALQCGEWGPFRQVIAGLDTAWSDLLAHKAGVPLARFLNPDAGLSVPCYASGIAIAQATDLIAQSRAAGFSNFKVKVGFDLARDATLLTDLWGGMSKGETLFIDANQAWNLENAQAFLRAIPDVTLGWLEEPLPADAPPADWATLAAASPMPLAGGENITGGDGFQQAITSRAFGVLQPDVAKWGGITGCWQVAQDIRAAGLRYCPHFLGGGIGLIASAHFLAAAGGDGLLEVDVNPNPLRDAFRPWGDATDKGHLTLSEAPGLGITALPPELDQYLTYDHTLSI
jgi:D-galactarolactone cycloisomerase